MNDTPNPHHVLIEPVACPCGALCDKNNSRYGRCYQCGEFLPSPAVDEPVQESDAVAILHKRFIGNDPLRVAQLEAERAWAFCERMGVPNLDIEREGKDKITLTELLAAYRRQG